MVNLLDTVIIDLIRLNVFILIGICRKTGEACQEAVLIGSEPTYRTAVYPDILVVRVNT